MSPERIAFVEELKNRTKRFAIRIIKMYKAIPKTDEFRIIGKQLVRSSCSVAANYRAVNRAKSNADYISKLGTVVEEADETVFWIEMLIESEIVKEEKLIEIKREANEILAVLSTALKNSKTQL